MEIVRPEDKSVLYDDIKVGEVFCCGDSHFATEDCYFIKTDITDCSQYQTTFALSLATGKHEKFKMKARVYPVKAKVVIET